MIWLTWRQFRTQAAVVFGVLAALAALMAATRPGMSHAYTTGMAACGSDCSAFTRRFVQDHHGIYFALIAVVIFTPAVIGLFWGAPLVSRELETGTHRLAWNQSVTRTRWLAVKLGLVGLAAVAAAGLGSMAVTWWSGPMDHAAAGQYPRLSPLVFDARGVVPLAYAAFAFALGVTAGMLVRRTVPAMAVTLVAFIAIQVAMPMLVRPHLMPPVRTSLVITRDNVGAIMASPDNPLITVDAHLPDPRAWIVSSHTVDSRGNTVRGVPISVRSGVCAPPAGGAMGPPKACFDKIAAMGYRQAITYHPARRFWSFQWIEAGIYAVLTLGLAGFCFRWIRHRLS